MNLPPGIEEILCGQWVVAGDTHIAVWSREHGSVITDPWLFKWLKPHLEGVKVVWDIGANIGDHTLQYLKWDMDVVAFEPNPTAFICLSHNCPEAERMNVAVSDTNGFATFTQLENVGASRIVNNGELQVITVALDEIKNLPNPDFVKLDVEGYEVFALRGMMETLRRCKPILFIEINRGALAANEHTPEDIRDILLELGYGNLEIYPTEAKWQDPQFDLLCKP